MNLNEDLIPCAVNKHWLPSSPAEYAVLLWLSKARSGNGDVLGEIMGPILGMNFGENYDAVNGKTHML